ALRQNEEMFRLPQMSETLAPIVLGASIRMQPAPSGLPLVPFPLVAIATTIVAMTATPTKATTARTSHRSRGVVSRHGVLTRPQWPCIGMNRSLEADSTTGFDQVSSSGRRIFALWR